MNKSNITKKVVVLNTEQMKAFEDDASVNFGITVDVMMQNAGKAIFKLAQKLFPRHPFGPNVLVVAGKGNNGGDALVAAQLLHQAGVSVTVFCPYPAKEFTVTAVRELGRVIHFSIPVFDSLKRLDLKAFDLIIDGLFGFSLKGDPRHPADTIIRKINASGVPVLSVDVPSGLDVRTGNSGSPTVRAAYTLALGMPKVGFKEHPDLIGQLYLGDLGIPEEAYREKAYLYPRFQEGIAAIV